MPQQTQMKYIILHVLCFVLDRNGDTESPLIASYTVALGPSVTLKTWRTLEEGDAYESQSWYTKHAQPQETSVLLGVRGDSTVL